MASRMAVAGLRRYPLRGGDDRQSEMLLALTPDQLVPADHPIRRVKPFVDAVLVRLTPAGCDRLPFSSSSTA